MKIPFDIKYRPQIESGEYKVVSRENKPARIVCWDTKSDHYPILALIDDDTKELHRSFTTKGRYYVEGDESSNDLFIIIPELKESDDERIRKIITLCLEECVHSDIIRDYEKNNAIAWLEKQRKKDEEILVLKDQIESLHAAIKALKEVHKIELEKQGEQKPAYKPKFHEGDWVVSPNGVYWHIDAIQDGRYQVSSDSGKCAEWPLNTNIYHRFTIQDAKDGDVLVDEDTNVIGIFDGIEGMCWHSKFYYSNFTKEFYGIECGGFHLKEFAKPATKEQRDQFEKAMADAGYTFDFEKKELKKVEQEPAWGKEDEYYYDIIQYILNNECVGKTDKENAIKWFNSLKDRVQPQPKRYTTK